MNLTIETIKSLPATEKRKVYWDSNHTGFGVRVAPTGLKTFVFMYRFQGKCQMLTIGRFPEESLEAMFHQVKSLKTALKEGDDPKLIISKEANHILNKDNAKPIKKILSEKEISELWNGLEKINLSVQIKTALKLMLFFGQTKKSILQTQWDHLDFQTNRWIIPKLEKKEIRMTVIPLLERGKALFESLPKVSKWVFPSTKRNNHISEASLDQAIRYIRLASDIPMLTASNIRRTIGLNMVNSGTHCLVVKDILGFKTEDNFPFIDLKQLPNYSFRHSTEGPGRINENSLKLDAFQLWHDYLSNILTNLLNEDLILTSERYSKV